MALAAGIAASSRHPLARALVARGVRKRRPAEGVIEHPGLGLRVRASRLGSATLLRRRRCAATTATPNSGSRGRAMQPVRFAFADRLRPDAAAAIAALRRAASRVELLSGDRRAAVAPVAAETAASPTGAPRSRRPDKAARLAELARAGPARADGRRRPERRPGARRRPRLDLARDRGGSDAERRRRRLPGRRLAAVLEILAGRAVAPSALVRQNLALALLYNLAAVPLAIAGRRDAADRGRRDVLVVAAGDRQRAAAGRGATRRRDPLMDSLLILIPVALLLGLLALAAFLWALRNGQFDDPDGAAGRILFDDDDR